MKDTTPIEKERKGEDLIGKRVRITPFAETKYLKTGEDGEIIKIDEDGPLYCIKQGDFHDWFFKHEIELIEETNKK